MRRTLAVISALLLLSACDLLKGLQNRKVLGAAVIATPKVAPTQAPGYPQGFTAIEEAVSAQVFFAERQDDLTGGGTSGAAPKGIAGATVTVAWSDAGGIAHSVALRPGTAAGQYQAAAADGLAYVANQRYDFKVVSAGEVFTASVTAPPATHIQEFPATHYLAYPSYSQFTSQTLTFAREGDDLAFYTVFKVHPQDPQASLDDVACTNLPISARADPKALLDLVLDASKWQQQSYTLLKTSSNAELSCFPEGPGTAPMSYAVGLGIGRKGTFSDNLFTGSVAFAGSFDAGAVIFTP